jgi:hypothetical protein
MSNNKVCFHPSYKVIFKCPFDDLMEKIWGDEFMYIGSWKVIGEGLGYSKILGK